jgi:ABC-type branched-subunit amino acid transport system ATPase component
MTDTGVIDERTAPATDGFAVQVRGLRMSYGSAEVLCGVDFDVRYGEVFCLLGPNGAGKTNIARVRGTSFPGCRGMTCDAPWVLSRRHARASLGRRRGFISGGAIAVGSP